MNISSAGSASADLSYAAAATPVAPQHLPQAVAAAPAPGTTAAGNSQAVDDAIKAANDAAQRAAVSVEFSKDESSGRMVISMVDNETGKVLRQLPSAAMIAVGEAIDSSLRGSTIHLKA
ncbi:MAG TPA: flagellar protein FlaG [Burkholderiales bacterium]|jgi:flagellar protein FlaG|nr:flagellar protein FlaG [Burkholderiales bacterium]